MSISDIKRPLVTSSSLKVVSLSSTEKTSISLRYGGLFSFSLDLRLVPLVLLDAIKIFTLSCSFGSVILLTEIENIGIHTRTTKTNRYHLFLRYYINLFMFHLTRYDIFIY